jgi:hypothetical protein
MPADRLYDLCKLLSRKRATRPRFKTEKWFNSIYDFTAFMDGLFYLFPSAWPELSVRPEA